MDIEFKRLTEADLTVVKKIYDWYIIHSTATFHTAPLSIEDLQEFIYCDHPVYQSFLIYCDQKLAGYCLLTHFKKRPAYTRSAEVIIYLDRDFQRRGIGRIALEYLESVARKKGLKNLIGTITADNIGSVTLFKKCGYRKCAHFRNIGEKLDKVLDVIVYQKEI